MNSDDRLLTIVNGPQSGQSFMLEFGEQTIGRIADNQIVIKDAAISKRHAKVSVQPTGIVIEDLGSSNGTYLNGQLVQQATPLSPGDVVRLGTVVEVRLGPPGAGSSIDELGPTVVPAPGDPINMAQSAPSPFSLVLHQDGQAAQTFSLAHGPQVMGRSPACDIHLPEAVLSKQHARLTVRPEGLFVEDLNSSNGTFINGQRIVGPVQVQPGDLLQIGSAVTMQVQGPGGAALPTTPTAAGDSGSNMALLGGVALLLIVLVGGGLAFLLWPAAEPEPEAVATATPLPSDTPPPAVALDFDIERSSVTLGECTTLRWAVENAQEVRLDGEQVSLVGDRNVCPREALKIYRLTALSAAGETSEATVQVEVPPTPAPPPGVEIEFDADALTAPLGECVTIRWAVQNAQAVRFEGEKVGASASRQVCPTEPDNVYRLLVQPLQGELLEQTIIINVPATPTPSPTPLPTATPTETPRPAAPRSPLIDQFMADQYQLNPGTCTTLRWTVRNAGVVRIDGNQVAGSGSMQACPPNAGSNNYTLVATGGGSSVQSSVTLNVNQPTAAPTPQSPYYQPSPQPIAPAPIAPSGPPSVDAWVTMQGDCVVYGWNVQNVKEIYFDGKGVTGQGTKRDWCLGDDDDDDDGDVNNPTLRVIHLDGRVEEIFISDAPGSPYWR